MNERDRERARLVAQEDQELCSPEAWVWLTFREESGKALGVIIVWGRGPVSAMREAVRLNCAISEHVTATKLPSWVSPRASSVNKRLSWKDATRLAAAWRVPLSPDTWPGAKPPSVH